MKTGSSSLLCGSSRLHTRAWLVEHFARIACLSAGLFSLAPSKTGRVSLELVLIDSVRTSAHVQKLNLSQIHDVSPLKNTRTRTRRHTCTHEMNACNDGLFFSRKQRISGHLLLPTCLRKEEQDKSPCETGVKDQPLSHASENCVYTITCPSQHAATLKTPFIVRFDGFPAVGGSCRPSTRVCPTDFVGFGGSKTIVP